MAKNELVKYHTELNTIPLRKFTPVEMNLFFSIISRMRDKGETTVHFEFKQLKELSDYKPTANRRFVTDLETTYDKLLDLRFGTRSSDGLDSKRFVMFTDFKIKGNTENPYVEISVHPNAIYLLNDLEEWVRYSLKQFNDLQSSYAKTMFRLLKQYRTKGVAYFSKNELFELLDIPASYDRNKGKLTQNVLNPIKIELAPIFKGLQITKKYGTGRGKPVIGYKFTFKAESKNANDFNKRAPRTELNEKIKDIRKSSLSPQNKDMLIEQLSLRLES
ncbi:replication initiation protein [Listeria sp. ILCC792]|uniref:replication initiation protein n=1 Tax=Listeria sp. ILCC792 TaxID=1918331 RepID=UPI000B588154|nr:replication initiation protein [Listeria sp. ILCC792]